MSNNHKNSVNQKSISVGDILMVGGFVTLGFTTFLGVQLLNGDVTLAAIQTIAVLAMAALFIMLLCKAKKAQNNRRQWMIAELISLIVFVALFLIFTGEARHFVYVSNHKSDLLASAKNDQTTIYGLFELYEQKESNDIATIKTSIENIPSFTDLYADNDTKDRLSRWNKQYTISSGNSYDKTKINALANHIEGALKGSLLGINSQGKNIENSDYVKLKQAHRENIDKIVSNLEKGANYNTFYSSSADLAKEYSDIAEALTGLSNHQSKCDLSFNDYSSPNLTSRMLKHTYAANGTLQLPRYFNGVKQSNASGWLLTLGMLVLILCGYFAQPRSRRVTVLSGPFSFKKKNYTNDGGIDLF